MTILDATLCGLSIGALAVGGWLYAVTGNAQRYLLTWVSVFGAAFTYVMFFR